jgi:hypothetical protein
VHARCKASCDTFFITEELASQLGLDGHTSILEFELAILSQRSNNASWIFNGDGKHRCSHFLGGTARCCIYKMLHLPRYASWQAWYPKSDCASQFWSKSWQQQDQCLLSAVNAHNDQFFPILLQAQKVMAQSTTPSTDTKWLLLFGTHHQQ